MQTQISSNTLTITINSFGAEICSVKNNSGLEFIWQAKKDVWARHAPVLFPIVGKLKDNFFVYDSKKYELSQHGFARDLEFTLIDKAQSSCTFQLQSNKKTKELFPFKFDFRISYHLEQDTLQTSYQVVNPSGETIYFSVGAHPGFNCPLLPNERFEDYYLEFEAGSFLQTQLANGLRSDEKSSLILENKKLLLTKTLFDNDALVFENGQINMVSLCSSKSNHKVVLKCHNWPFFGVWSKKGNTDFICLEPWYGITDSIDSTHELVKKAGVIELKPGKEFNCAFSLIFS